MPVDHSEGVEPLPLYTVGELHLKHLKKPSVRLESCDKIWGTLQLIKNLQDDQSVADQSSQFGTSKKLIESSKLCSMEPCQPRNKIRVKIQSNSDIAMKARKTMPSTPGSSNCLQEPKNNGIRSPTQNASNSKVPTTKINNAHEKWKCILCSRLSKDIVNHLKIFHKVASVSAIIQQCERLTPKNSKGVLNGNSSKTQEPESQDHLVDVEKNSHTKKRKKSTFNWSGSKKRQKLGNSLSTNSNPVINNSFGPYKCDVCFGLYKSQKTFMHHQSLHRRRGQTRENFDSFICRFKNSPLRIANVEKEPDESISHTTVQPKLPKSQTAITSYFERLSKPVSPLNQVDTKIPQKLTSDEIERSVQKQIECGSIRPLKTHDRLQLHQGQCQKRENDEKSHNIDGTDSSTGLSIKIKKKENNSYEVISEEVSPNKNFVRQKISEDSDASSNDSGLVLIESNRKISQPKLPGYKSHSIMRIQIAEDDEDVDIEDDDSDPGLCESNLSIANIIDHPQDSKVFPANSIESERPELSDSDSKNSSRRRQEVHQTSLLSCSEKASRGEQCRSEGDTSSQTLPQSDIKLGVIYDTRKVQLSENNQCFCGKKFTHLKYFNIHVRRLHPQLLKCSYCMTNFDKVEIFLDHKCNIVEGNIFIEPIIQTKCLKCDVPLDLGEPFDKHMKSHNPDGPTSYQCFKCDKKFDNPHQRRSHFSKEHGVSPCAICGKRLHLDQLVKHEAYHDGLGHPCHLCKKTFTQKSLLKKHFQNTHEPRVNESVTCSVCSQSMKLRFLKKHMSLHLHTEVCGKCDQCDQGSEQENPKDLETSDDMTICD